MAMPNRRPRCGDAAAYYHAIRDRRQCARRTPRGPRGLMLRRWTFPLGTRRNPPSKVFMAIAWIGMRSRSARPARKTSLFGKPALEAGRDEKARSVVALSRVPRLAGFAGSPPAAGPYSAVNRPLVRIPANQHTTTGTCEIGQSEIYAIRPALQEIFSKNWGAARAIGAILLKI
jgi:hypothetical protein